MTTYQRKQPRFQAPELVDAIRLNVQIQTWVLGWKTSQVGDWLVQVPNGYQYVMSDDEFRREFEEVPTAHDGKWITLDGRPVEKISVAYNEVSRRVDKPWKPLTHADLDHVDKPHGYQCAICKAPATLHNLCCCGHAKCIGCANCCRIRGNIEAFAKEPSHLTFNGPFINDLGNGGWWCERRVCHHCGQQHGPGTAPWACCIAAGPLTPPSTCVYGGDHSWTFASYFHGVGWKKTCLRCGVRQP